MTPKTIETICIGIVAKNMGFADQSKVGNAGREVFKFIGELTFKEFRKIKKLNSNRPIPGGK